MKSIRTIAAMMFFAVLFAVPTFAQQTAAGATKVAIINSAYFDDEKAGITKYIQAFKTLQTEFKPSQDAILALEARLKKVGEEFKTLQGSSAVDPKSLDAKREEGEKLELEYKYKQEQYKAALQRRLEAVIAPVQFDIGKAIGEYAKSKGYTVVFDVAKDEKGMLIWAAMDSVDMTAEFIKFYNARPAGTASAAAPK